MKENKPYKVRQKFRTSDLSYMPGGCTVIVEMKNGQVLEYDNIKYPTRYISKVISEDVNAIRALQQLDQDEGNTTPSFTAKRSTCSYCGILHAPPKVKLNPCSGCHSVYYCSKEHQVMDWKLAKYGGRGHKEICKQLQ